MSASPTSYIPTAAAQVTRLADSAQMTGTDFSSWFNQTDGTFVIQHTVGSKVGLLFEVATSSRAAGDVSALTAGTVSGGSGLWNYYASGFASLCNLVQSSASTTHKNAVTYKTNQFAYALNGGTVTTDVSGTVAGGMTQIAIGSQVSAASQMPNAPIASITYYNRAIPAATLQYLTAPTRLNFSNPFNSQYAIGSASIGIGVN